MGAGGGCAPFSQTEAIYDLTELKRLNYNSCVINAGIIEFKKASLILYVLSLANHLGGGEAGLLGGKLPPPASPSR